MIGLPNFQHGNVLCDEWELWGLHLLCGAPGCVVDQGWALKRSNVGSILWRATWPHGPTEALAAPRWQLRSRFESSGTINSSAFSGRSKKENSAHTLVFSLTNPVTGLLPCGDDKDFLCPVLKTAAASLFSCLLVSTMLTSEGEDPQRKIWSCLVMIEKMRFHVKQLPSHPVSSGF